MRRINAEAKSIPVSDARVVARILDSNPAEFKRLLAGTGLTEAEFLDDATLLSGNQQLQMIRNAREVSDDPALGLRIGQWLTPSTHGYLGFLAHSSPDAKTATELFAEYLPSRIPFLEITTSLNDGWLDCELTLNTPTDDFLAQWLVEPVFLALQSLIEFILRRQLVEGRLRFSYPEPDYASRYRHHFPSHLEFNASGNIFSIPLYVCETANASANHEIYLFALEQYRSMRAEVECQPNPTARSVEKVLLSSPLGTLSIDDVASALFISRRTLIRRLEEEGVTFRGLKEAQLSALAAKYLEETQIPTASIAELLNYHDTASFRRAFKRWFNKTPSEYRKDNETSGE